MLQEFFEEDILDEEVILEWAKKVILCVQEVVTLRKKYLINLHQKLRFTPFINYKDTLG